MHGVAIFLQAFVAASIFFVWGVRHSHVADAILLLVGINRPRTAIFGGLMIGVLMAAVVLNHFRVDNPSLKMLLSAALLGLLARRGHPNYRLNFPIHTWKTGSGVRDQSGRKENRKGK